MGGRLVGGHFVWGGVCNGKHDGHPPHLSILSADTASSAITHVSEGDKEDFGVGEACVMGSTTAISPSLISPSWPRRLHPLHRCV